MDIYTLSSTQWLLAGTAAFIFGFSKTGVAGLGILAVAIFANVINARESTGVVLPLLIVADVVAVASYLGQARWKHLFRLFPWAVTGIIVGYFTMDKFDALAMRRLIGLILVGMAAMQVRRAVTAARHRRNAIANPATDQLATRQHSPLFAPVMGVLAGFTTMVANAAGPIMNLYLLAMKMPKIQFMGTAAWYFFTLNCFKVPFSWNMGLINKQSIILDAKLAPCAIVGALCGRIVIHYIDQKMFEALALILALVAGIRLLIW